MEIPPTPLLFLVFVVATLSLLMSRDFMRALLHNFGLCVFAVMVRGTATMGGGFGIFNGCFINKLFPYLLLGIVAGLLLIFVD